MKKGKLIVIEGSDGAGKSTQMNLLLEYFKKIDIPVNTLKFPQHGISFFGKMVDQFLRGEFGPLSDVNPYLVSVLYAMDRAGEKEKMDKWLNNGEYIVLDRYVPSNLAHQCGRLPKRQRLKFLKWDTELEYTYNKIPQEDIVLYFYVPYQTSIKLMQNKDRHGRAYTKGRNKDIVEKDVAYLKNAVETYKWLVKKFPHWVMINCIDKNGNMKSREAIHDEVKNVLYKKGILVTT